MHRHSLYLPVTLTAISLLFSIHFLGLVALPPFSTLSARAFQPYMSKYDCDVLVLGAGMAGMFASVALSAAGHKVILLEGRDRLGGRMHHYSSEHIKAAELGASFIHYTDGNPLYDLAKHLNLDLHFPMQLDPKKPLAYEKGHVMEPHLAIQLFKNLNNAFFVAAHNYAQLTADPSETESLEDFVLSDQSPLYDNLKSEAERKLARRAINSISGYSGADHNATSLRYWGFEDEFSGPEGIIKQGYGEIIKWLESQSKKRKVSIRLEEEITAIEDNAEEEFVTVHTKKGSYTARATIGTFPLGVLKERPPLFKPDLPQRRKLAINRLGMGVLNKIVVQYPEKWWQEIDWQFLVLEPEDAKFIPGLENSFLSVTSYEPLNGAHTLVFFVGASIGRAMEAHSDQAMAEWIHDVLIKYVPHERKSIPKPVEVFLTRWASDDFSRGSYSYIPKANGTGIAPSPLDMLEVGRPLWDGRLCFAGEHTSHAHFATVHGAMISGHREAARIASTKLGREVPEIRALFK